MKCSLLETNKTKKNKQKNELRDGLLNMFIAMTFRPIFKDYYYTAYLLGTELHGFFLSEMRVKGIWVKLNCLFPNVQKTYMTEIHG